MKKIYFLTILLSFFISKLNYSQLPTEGMVAYYPFSGNANDTSGNNNHGIVHGATLAIDRYGDSNKCYKFDGVNDYIEIPNSTSLQQINKLTFIAWVKLNTTVPQYQNIIIKSPDSGVLPDWSLAFNYSQLRPHANTSIGGWEYFNCNPPLTTYGWHMIAMVYDSSSLKGYIDGEFAGSISKTGILQQSTAPIRLGVYTPSVEPNWFNGYLDDVRIYNRDLTMSEIKALYVPNEPISNANLIAFFPFTGNAIDSSGHGFNGTINGASLINNRTGESNSAYYFDGLDDKIDIGILPPINDISVSLWFSKSIASNYPISGEADLFGFDKRPDFKYFKFGFYSSYQDKISFGFATSSSNIRYKYASTSILDTNWHHVVVTRTTTNSKIFLDGIEQSLTSVSSLGNPTGEIFPNISTYIGTVAGLNDTKFEGKIDDIRIYERVLSDSEVVSLYQSLLSVDIVYHDPIKNKFNLFQNYPNPFNPNTLITYDLPKSVFVRLKIYNLLGQEIRTLIKNHESAGQKHVVWDGKDNHGNSVSSGIYLYRLEAGEFTKTMKLMLIK